MDSWTPGWIGFSLDSNASNGSELKVRILVAKLSQRLCCRADDQAQSSKAGQARCINFRYAFLGIVVVLVPMETNRVGHDGPVVQLQPQKPTELDMDLTLKSNFEHHLSIWMEWGMFLNILFWDQAGNCRQLKV